MLSQDFALSSNLRRVLAISKFLYNSPERLQACFVGHDCTCDLGENQTAYDI